MSHDHSEFLCCNCIHQDIVKRVRALALGEAAEVARNFAPKGPRGVVSVTALQIEKYIRALIKKPEGSNA